jgi:hypothetical protein
MVAVDDIKLDLRLRGLDNAGVAEVVQVVGFGVGALNPVFRVNGPVSHRLVFHGNEASFELVEGGRAYAFEAEGGLPQLASEAYCARLAHLFEPYLAVGASHRATRQAATRVRWNPSRSIAPHGRRH